MVNILLTSVGRRAYLIDFFRQSLAGAGTVHAMNSRHTYALTRADVFTISPPIHESHYIPFLLEYCKKHAIDAVMSLFDPDIPILAQSRDGFLSAGTRVIHADEASVEACNDKWRFHRLAQDLGLPSPDTYISVPEAREAIRRGNLLFPLVIKPRWGMASIGVSIVNNLDEFQVLYDRCLRDALSGNLRIESAKEPRRAVLIQERAHGIEHGLTVVNDLEGCLAAVLAVRKVEMRAGETFVGVTVDAAPFVGLAEALSASLRHQGALSVDVFYDGTEMAVTDLNCRISGHYPISHIAGADLPTQIVSWLAGGDTSQELLSCEIGVTVVKDLVPRRSKEFSSD